MFFYSFYFNIIILPNATNNIIKVVQNMLKLMCKFQSKKQSVVVTKTKNTQRTEPVAVGIGQYIYSITNKVTPVDCCVCQPCCGQ